MSNSSSPIFFKNPIFVIVIISTVITAVMTIFVIIPSVHHDYIDKMSCTELESNLNIAEDQRHGEWLYKFYPHLEKNFKEKC